MAAPPGVCDGCGIQLPCVDCCARSSKMPKLQHLDCEHNSLLSGQGMEWPTDENSSTAKAIKHILNRINLSISDRFTSKGSLTKHDSLARKVLFECIIQPCLSDQCSKIRKETESILGVSRHVLQGAIARVEGTEKDMSTLTENLNSGSIVQRKTRSDAYHLPIIFDWFHLPGFGPYGLSLPDHCDNIGPNKAEKGRLNNVDFTWKGGTVKLQCQKLERYAYGRELAADYLDSQTHAQYMLQHPFAKLSIETIMQCFCRCNRSRQKINECACPTCTEMECELRALRDIGVFSPKCDDPVCIEFKKHLRSTGAWMDFNSCEKVAFKGFKRQSSTEEFMMRRYECCLDSIDGENNVSPCDKCCHKMQLPTCKCFSRDKHVTWLKRQWTIEGSTHNVLVQRLRDYDGRVDELWKSITVRTKPFMMHCWIRKFTSQCFKIDFDRFDADTEVAILADFASAMELGSGFVGTCESRGTCNLYVVLVCYKTKEGTTKCDYVRFWSAAKSSGAFHHHALHVVVKYLRDGPNAKVPGLTRVILYTDGDGTAYKGFQNFGRMSYWPLLLEDASKLTGKVTSFIKEAMVDAEGIEVVHCFFCSNHASGVQDSAGKDPRIAMMDAMGQSKASFCDAHECYLWCKENLTGPKHKKRSLSKMEKGNVELAPVESCFSQKDEPSTTSIAVSKGHFIANDYVWYCLAYGERDPHKDKYDVISEARKEYTPVKGTNSYYEFVATRNEDENGNVVTGIYTRKFPCRCDACYDGDYANCPIFHINGNYKWHDVSLEKVFTVTETKDKREKDKQARIKKKSEQLAAHQSKQNEQAAGSTANG